MLADEMTKGLSIETFKKYQVLLEISIKWKECWSKNQDMDCLIVN